MKICKDIIISKNAPSGKNCLWAKPSSDGFVLYLLDGGKWKPLQLVEAGNINTLKDDTPIKTKYLYDIIGNFNS